MFPFYVTDILGKLVAGMQCHLESSVPKIRTVGMVVAEAVTEVLGGETTQDKLKFEVRCITTLGIRCPLYILVVSSCSVQ